MLIRKPEGLRYSDVTPRNVYLNRRQLLAAAGLALPFATAQAGIKLAGVTKSKYTVSEKLTPIEAVTTYNNFYEFGTSKDEPAKYARNFNPDKWQLSFEGMVAKKKVIDLDAIRKAAPLEERVYRHRCVEAWSMVIPWVGYSLSTLIKLAEPLPSAKFVAFESYYNTGQMPEAAGIRFPYVEGLRLDEAMHPLAMMAVGLYGETLPPQNGTPLRLVVPWKYGFKGIKSIVKMRFTDKEPPTTWNIMAANEYGFYSNVNPKKDHPRWSQASERRIGEFLKRPTLMFNGYGDEVASLYAGMDLNKNY